VKKEPQISIEKKITRFNSTWHLRKIASDNWTVTLCC